MNICKRKINNFNKPTINLLSATCAATLLYNWDTERKEKITTCSDCNSVIEHKPITLPMIARSHAMSFVSVILFTVSAITGNVLILVTSGFIMFWSISILI